MTTSHLWRFNMKQCQTTAQRQTMCMKCRGLRFIIELCSNLEQAGSCQRYGAEPLKSGRTRGRPHTGMRDFQAETVLDVSCDTGKGCGIITDKKERAEHDRCRPATV